MNKILVDDDNEIKSPDLLPCPFCGCSAVIVILSKFNLNYIRFNKDIYYISCNGCGVTTSSYDNSEDVIKLWNRRHEGNRII